MIRGRFKNELGAHAGFDHAQMQKMLGEYFSEVNDVTQEYYEEIYKTKKNVIKLMYKLEIQDYLLPAVYYRAKK